MAPEAVKLDPLRVDANPSATFAWGASGAARQDAKAAVAHQGPQDGDAERSAVRVLDVQAPGADLPLKLPAQDGLGPCTPGVVRSAAQSCAVAEFLARPARLGEQQSAPGQQVSALRAGLPVDAVAWLAVPVQQAAQPAAQMWDEPVAEERSIWVPESRQVSVAPRPEPGQSAPWQLESREPSAWPQPAELEAGGVPQAQPGPAC